MANLAFPFWTLIAADALVCSIDSEAIAFTSTERATAFLNGQTECPSELKLVSRQSMRDLLAECRKRALTGFRLDPAPDGSAGMRLPLEDLLAEFS